MKNVFILGLLLAAADPFLLYIIYESFGLAAALGTAFIPPLLGPRLLAWVRLRAQKSAPRDLMAMAGSMGDQFLFMVAFFLFIYPGPLTTLIALLMLIPAVRRLLQAWAMRKMAHSMASGNMSMMSRDGGVMFSSGFGAPPAAPGNPPFRGPLSSGGLKRADGRVVEGPPPLGGPALPMPDKSDER